MKFISYAAAGLMTLGLAACSGDKAKTGDFTVVELVATHAFDTKQPVSALTFVPNDAAPWLGRIILMTDTGQLLSTDIEGTAFVPVTKQKYKEVYGLNRKKSAGLFIAINEAGSLEAFIESDDEGGFSAMTYSGNSLKVKRFCLSTNPEADTLKLLGTDKKTYSLNFTVKDNVIEQTSQIATTPECAGIPHFAYNKGSYQLTNKDGLINVQSQDGNFRLVINDGLSIRGLKNANYVNATLANYGGAAFKDGVVAMVDADENRIVFLSLDYMAGKIPPPQ